MQASFFNIKFSLIQKKNGGKPLAYIFTQTQKKKNLFCKCFELSFPVFHLLSSTVNSRESLFP